MIQAQINGKQDEFQTSVSIPEAIQNLGAFVPALCNDERLIGWLAKLAVLFFGVGAFLLERRDLFGKLRERGLA